MSYVEFNGHRSDEYDLYLEAGLSFSSPARDMEFEKIAGIDGEIAIGDQTLKNTKLSFPFRLRNMGETVEKRAEEISNWLKKDALWHDLIFGGDPKHVYSAIYVDEYDIDRIVSTYGKVVLGFTVKPYKFLKSGLTPLTSPATLNNPTTRDARPLITIKGTGNITLQIGAEKLTLKNVDGGIVIDSLKQVVTNLAGTRPAWDKVTSYPLPVIKPGKQTVLTTGTVTSLTIVPRYEVIV